MSGVKHTIVNPKEEQLLRFPKLHDWQDSSLALQQAVSLVGQIQKALLSPRENFLHLSLHVQPDGVESQTLPFGGRIRVNFRSRELAFVRSNGSALQLPLAEHTQGSLFSALLDALREDELAEFFQDEPAGSLAEALVAKLQANGSAGASLTLETVTQGQPLFVNPQTGSDFADVLYGMFTAIARFRARLEGHLTPAILWPHHLDLSTLWFPPSNPGMDDHRAHLSFGFAPFTPGQYPEPYLYAYAYPYPEPFDSPQLPEPAFWHDEGWRGVVVKYEDLLQQSDPLGFIEDILLQLFNVFSPLLDR